MEEVALCAGHKALLEVDDNSVLIVDNDRGSLGQKLWPHPVHLLNIVMIVLIGNVTQLKGNKLAAVLRHS